MSDDNLRVVYLVAGPRPYFVERSNAVARRGTLHLQLWFVVVQEKQRSWEVNEAEWMFTGRYIAERTILGRPWRIPVQEIINARPDVLVVELDRPEYFFSFLVGRRYAKRVAVRGIPHFDQFTGGVKVQWWREAARYFVYRAADGVKVPGPFGLNQAMKYGFPRDRVFFVKQSIDLKLYASAREVPPGTRAARREELGLSGCVFIFVGRLLQAKGLQYLMDAYRKVSQAGADVSLLIVGNGADEEFFRARATGLPRVVFAGFVQPKQLPHYYALADVFIFPTLGDPNGLVLEEAMAAGLPVISSTGPADVRERVPEGDAGYVVPAADPDALAEKMELLATNSELRSRLGQRAGEIAESFAPERYAEDFERFVSGVLAKPRRRSPEAVIASILGWLLALLAGTRLPDSGATPRTTSEAEGKRSSLG